MTTNRVAAIARLVATLIASVATAIGLSYDADTIFTVIAGALALVCFVYSWWKNNNLTNAAAQAQNFLDALKTGSVDVSEVDTSDTDETDDADDTEDSEE